MEVLLIKDGVVESAISANDLDSVSPYYPDHLCVERKGEEWIGFTYTDGVFLPPKNHINNSQSAITRLAFLSRFTDEEAIGIDLASQGATVEAATIRRALKKIDAAEFIDLQTGDTRRGVFALEQFGLLNTGRALEILDSPIQAKEHYIVG